MQFKSINKSGKIKNINHKNVNDCQFKDIFYSVVGTKNTIESITASLVQMLKEICLSNLFSINKNKRMTT